MKILSLGLGFNGGRGLTAFLQNSNINTLNFYDYDSLPIGEYEESISGANQHLDDQFLNCDALVDMPHCFSYAHAYDSYPTIKFVYIKRNIDSWIESFKNAQSHYDHDLPYPFEELFCNIYATTGKTKMTELTEEEARAIYNAHDNAVTDFFTGKENFLKVDLDDTAITEKLKTFLEITEDVIFEDLFVI
jgi:hypothetical protein